MSMFVVSITLAPSLILISKSNPPVSDLALDSTVLISFCVTCDGYWSLALSINKGDDNCSSRLLLYSLTGTFSVHMWSASTG